MRVALVVHHARPTGGQDRYALELARHLAARCEMTLVAIRVIGDLPRGVRLLAVRAPDRPLLLTAPLFRRAASALLRHEHFDVVHTIGGALPGASVVTAQFCHATWAAVAPRASLNRRLVTRQAIADERAAYRHPALRAVVAVSRTTAADVALHYGPLRAPVTVIPNGVDLDVFRPKGAPRPARDPAVVLFVGAYERKGLETAIEALALMRTRARLRAVGAGPRRRYERLAELLGVADRVALEPPRPDIAAVFAEADAFVFPTRYDPFGMVVAEALACGVPVVTSAAAGAADLITPDEHGYVVPDAHDTRAFADALDAVLADRERMSAAAPSAVRDLSWDAIARRTLDVYRAAS